MENKKVKLFYLFLLHLTLNFLLINAQKNGFPGTVELVQNNNKNINNNRNNNRRSRVSKDFVPINNDDIEEKRFIEIENIDRNEKLRQEEKKDERYLRSFQRYINSDQENLTEQQKLLIKNIADRIARHGVSIMNNDTNTDTINDTTEINENEGRSTATTSKTVNKKKINTTNRPMSSIKATTKRVTTTTSAINNKSNNKLKETTATAKIPTTVAESKTTGINIELQTNNKKKKNNLRQTTKQPQKNIDINEPTAIINGDNATTSAIIDSLSRDNAREDFHVRERPQTLVENNKNKKTPATSGTGKPTKYHYYPHNQHIYLLPECAIQQVCNAVYVRLNYTQPLCACPSRYRDPCSASLNEDDLHTTKLIGDAKRKAITLAKTCEATTEMRECRAPKDWSLLALQNTRTGKSHYLVICRCPDNYKLDGPMAHDQPTYASVPGIRVFGMMCVKPGAVIRRPTEIPPIKRYQNQKPSYFNEPIVGQYSTVGPTIQIQNPHTIIHNQHLYSTVRPSNKNKYSTVRPADQYSSVRPSNQNQYSTTRPVTQTQYSTVRPADQYSSVRPSNQNQYSTVRPATQNQYSSVRPADQYSSVRPSNQNQYSTVRPTTQNQYSSVRPADQYSSVRPSNQNQYSTARPTIQYSSVRPTIQNQYSSIRPTTQNDYDNLYQSNSYQYLKRPGSPINKPSGNQGYQNSVPVFSNGYGRTSDEQEQEVEEEQEEQIEEDEDENLSRRKRSSIDDESMPEFPWHRVKELHDSLDWD